MNFIPNEKPTFYALCLDASIDPKKLTNYSMSYRMRVESVIGTYLTPGKIYPAVVDSNDPFNMIRLLRMDRKRSAKTGRLGRAGWNQGIWKRARFKILTLEEFKGGVANV